MKLSKTDIYELKALQPRLAIVGNQISGFFYLSASLENKSKNRGKKVNCHPWNCESKNSKHISDCFDIDIILDKKLYPERAFSGKILSWKEKIPEEYYHVNGDNSLCLGEAPDIKTLQKQYSFAKFINMLLMQYFYYMHHTKTYQKEPYEAYRHGLFAALNLAYEDVKSNDKLISKHLNYGKPEFEKILKKTGEVEIKKTHNCPFCTHKILVKNCNRHRKQIKGYNKLMPYLQK